MNPGPPATPEASIEEADARRAVGAVWVDVREPEEWVRARIPATYHLPMSTCLDAIVERWPDRTTSINVSCATGARSAYVTKALIELGYVDTVNVVGGIRAWAIAGREVTTGPE